MIFSFCPHFVSSDKNRLASKRCFATKRCPNDRVIILNDLNLCTFWVFTDNDATMYFSTLKISQKTYAALLFFWCGKSTSFLFLRTIIIFFIGLNSSLSLHLPSIEFSKLLYFPPSSFLYMSPFFCAGLNSSGTEKENRGL